MTLSYLFRNRERPGLMSIRFFKVWAKRLLTAPSLASILARNLRLRLRGAAIADLCVIEPLHLEGDRSNLRVGRGSFIGRESALFLHEQIRIGGRVVINGGVTIITSSHDVTDPSWAQYAKAVVIEEYA